MGDSRWKRSEVEEGLDWEWSEEEDEEEWAEIVEGVEYEAHQTRKLLEWFTEYREFKAFKMDSPLIWSN